jgi:hypothetical protein
MNLCQVPQLAVAVDDSIGVNITVQHTDQSRPLPVKTTEEPRE